MRTLSSQADAARQLASYGCLAGLKIEFGGAIGDKWYTSGWSPSDVDADDLRERVLSWRECSALLEGDGTSLAQAASSVTIADPDGELRGWFEDVQLQRLPCELHWALWTPGEAEPTTSTSVRILRGTLMPPVNWTDAARDFTFEISDLSPRHIKTVGARATRDRFPNVGEDEEGLAIPLVFGRPDRVRAVRTNGGARCRLGRPCDEDDMTLYLDDAEAFPQGEEIDIRIGREVITGSLVGNAFTVTARGKSVHSGTTTHDSPGNCTLKDTGLPGSFPTDNELAGYYVQFEPDKYPWGNVEYQTGWVGAPIYINRINLTSPGDGSQARRIVRYDAAAGVVEFLAPFVVEQVTAASSGFADVTGTEVRIRSGTTYSIRTLPEAHSDGDEVHEHHAPAYYAAALLSSCSVRNVYVHGVRRHPRRVLVAGPATMYGGSLTLFGERLMEQYASPPKEPPGWIRLPGEYWQAAPKSESWGSYIRLVLNLPPSMLATFDCDTDEVLVDVTGPPSSSDPDENPAKVIKRLYGQWGGIWPDFSDAEAFLTNWRMSFARADVWPLNDLAAELAYQARCRIRWLGEKPDLVYQHAHGGAADVTLARSRVVMDSPRASRESLEHAASAVTVRWTENGREKRHTERDTSVESSIGQREIEIDCWAYDRSDEPVRLARFILERTKRLHDLAMLDASAFAAALEPGDVVELDSDLSGAWPSAPVKGDVLEAAHRQGESPARADTVGLRLRLFRWAGCSVSCEGSCETTACESACESYWEPDSVCWTCETSCQASCEMFCTTAAENVCAETTCEASLTTGCVVYCQASEMVTDCGACESFCQSDCESAGAQ